jgi:hypothetical protein
MKTTVNCLAVLFLSLAAVTPSYGGTAGSYPQKGTLSGTEKVYLDDSGADKYGTVSSIWKGMVLSGGWTASGSTAWDLSGSSAAFQTSTGLNTFNGSGHAFASELYPVTNDGAALGDTTHQFSDLFLASGGTLNFANGNWLATHTSGILTVGTGDLRVTTPGTNAASVVTLSATQTLTNKTLTAPVLGAATATSLNGLTITSSTGTLTIANGKTVSVSNTLTFTGTDSSSVAFGTGGTVAYAANNLSVFAATTSAQLRGLISDETGSGAAVFATTPTLVTPVIGAATGTSLTVTGALKSSGTAGVGYVSGAGGTVTQATSKSTGVTINKTAGQITLNNAALASGAAVSFTVTNSTVAGTDVVSAVHGSAGTAGAYEVDCNAIGSGSFKITVGNHSGGSLSEAIVLNFVVIKGANN